MDVTGNDSVFGILFNFL